MTIRDLLAELEQMTPDLDEITVPVDLQEEIENWLSSERLKKHAEDPIEADEPARKTKGGRTRLSGQVCWCHAGADSCGYVMIPQL